MIDRNESGTNMSLDEDFGIPMVNSHCFDYFESLEFNQSAVQKVCEAANHNLFHYSGQNSIALCIDIS
jgi:hypothetical protein